MVYLGHQTDWRPRLSTFNHFSMIIGAPTSTSSRYRVSRDHLPIRFYLTEKRRGLYYRSKGPPVSLVSRITILSKHYCLSLCNCSSQAAKNVRIDGNSALVAPSDPRIVSGTLPTDEQIKREGN